MGDRGIALAVPDLDESLLRAGDFVTWEVRYNDGTYYAEREGGKTQHIDRNRLASFLLLKGGDLLLETQPPPGATGHNLCYRRRTMFGDGDRQVIFLVAWVPMGPIAVHNPENGLTRFADRFDFSDQEIAPPDMPHLGETFTLGDILSLT